MGSPDQPNMDPPNMGLREIAPREVAGPMLAAAEERDSSKLIIVIAVVGVIAVMLALAFLLREPPKAAKTISPYASSLKLYDFRMSAAENFVGSTVSYFEGAIINYSDKTLTHAVVGVVFKDDMGQIVGKEEMPLRVLKSSEPYPDFVDLSVSPLPPGKTQYFRLTFDAGTISSQWNRRYPEISVTDVTVK
jgi:hypothetical protein